MNSGSVTIYSLLLISPTMKLQHRCHFASLCYTGRVLAENSTQNEAARARIAMSEVNFEAACEQPGSMTATV
jgi:hypothetical protein